MESDQVELGLGGPLNPGVMRPSGSTDYLYVVMPMQIL
jgi:DNA polymerase III sliding clamp (beta) subunit (PCNA family)